MKPKKFYLELYNVNIFYFIGWQKELFSSYCNKRFNVQVPHKHALAETTFIYEGMSPKCILIWLSPEENTAHTLAHEAKHAVSYIHEYVGIRADHVNDEAEAYLIGLIIKKSGWR